MCIFRNIKGILYFLAATLAVLACLVAQNSTAFADDQADLEAKTQITVNVKKTGGNAATTVSLDRKTYNAGDTVYLSWKGAAVGNDFYIPTSIVYGNKKINASDILEIDTLQTLNTEYKRRMNSYATMTEYNSLKSNVTSTHTISLGTMTVGTTVTVNYSRLAPVYRLYNKITSEHLFTTNKKEYDNYVTLCMKDKDFWIGEGISWLAATKGTAVHRLYNKTLGAMGRSSHYYTSDKSEIASLKKQGWVDDGTSYQFYSSGSVPIWTCYNENLGSAHHYTSSKTEWQNLLYSGWNLESKKNGSEGVFKGVIATTWSYEENFYVVEHKLDGVVKDREYVSGLAWEATDAKAKDYPGYKKTSITRKTISENNTTVVQVNYTKRNYTVTFNGKGHEVNAPNQTVQYGAKVTNPGNQNDGGYQFKGWYYDSACTQKFYFNTSTMPAGNLTLYAKWDTNPLVRYVVLHRFQKASDGTYPEMVDGVADEGVEYEYKYAPIGSTTTEVAKSVDGFSEVNILQRTLVEHTSTLDPATGKPEVNPETGLPDNWVDIRYTRDKHSVTFDLNGTGSFPSDITSSGYTVSGLKATKKIMQGSTVDSIVPTANGYTFVGWYTEQTCTHSWGHGGTGAKTMPNSDLTLYAHWAKGNVYNLSFDTNGADDAANFESDSFRVEANVIPEKPDPDPTKTGYTFGGWYEDSTLQTQYNFDKPLTGDKKLYAKWIANKNTSYTVYHIRQYTDGGYENGEVETDYMSGTTGELTKAIADRYYAGFVADTKIEQQTIAGDGSTVVEVHYARTAYKLKFNTQGHGTVSDAMVLYGALVSQPTAEPTAFGYSFEGWYKDAACTDKFQFGIETMPDRELELYAKWNMIADFWLAPSSRITTGTDSSQINQVNANYTSPEDGVVRIDTEIQNDADILARGTSSSKYQETYDLYKKYMEEDSYHLYARWKGATTDTSGKAQKDNEYLEFRIIGIGQHDNDGSGLTFQMVHTLPTGYQMNTTNTTVGGWSKSKLATAINFEYAKDGSITNLGDISKCLEQGFIGSIKEVNKTTSKGSKSTETETRAEKLFVLSYGEVTGTTASYAASEGTQYAYFSHIGVTSNGTNEFLTMKTRAQNLPSKVTSGNSSYAWWLRSASLSYETSYLSVGRNPISKGNPSISTNASNSLGVVLAFSL